METKFYVPSSPTIQNAIDWVSERFKLHHPVILRILPCEKSGKMTEGRTRKLLARAGGYIGVTLKISNGMKYPHRTQYVKELPPIMVNSFEEELILVLSHELRHVVQFSLGLHNRLSPHELEIDAEAVGYSMLEAHRINRGY